MPVGSLLATACQRPFPCSKHTCSSSHASAPHDGSLLRTHDDYFSRKNLLAILLSQASRELQLEARTPSSRISSPTRLPTPPKPPQTICQDYFSTIASACQQDCIHSGLQDRHVSARTRTVAPFLTVRHKHCHVLTVMQHAVLRTITLLVRLSCRHRASLGIVAIDYLGESCILAFASTSQICCGDVFAAEVDGEGQSTHTSMT